MIYLSNFASFYVIDASQNFFVTILAIMVAAIMCTIFDYSTKVFWLSQGDSYSKIFTQFDRIDDFIITDLTRLSDVKYFTFCEYFRSPLIHGDLFFDGCYAA